MLYRCDAITLNLFDFSAPSRFRQLITACGVSGNQVRMLPNFVHHMWFASGGGLAATAYGPSLVETLVGDGIRIRVLEETMYGSHSFDRIPGAKTEKTAKKWRKNEQKWARYGLRKRVRAAVL